MGYCAGHPPGTPLFEEEQLELGEIGGNNDKPGSSNDNSDNYNIAYDALIADGHSEEDAKGLLDAAMEEEDHGSEILPNRDHPRGNQLD